MEYLRLICIDDMAAQIFRAPGAVFRTSYLKNLPVSVWDPTT